MIIFLDGFDYYTDLVVKWPAIAAGDAVGGTNANIKIINSTRPGAASSVTMLRDGVSGGAGAVAFKSGLQNTGIWLPIYWPIATAYTTLVVGFAYQWPNWPVGPQVTNDFIQFLNYTVSNTGTVTLKPVNTIGVTSNRLCMNTYNQNTNSQIALLDNIIPTPTFVPNTWYYIEILNTITANSSQANGTTKIMVNGTLAYSNTGIINNGNGLNCINGINIGTNSTLPARSDGNLTGATFDDLYICTGTGNNSTFLGMCRITTKMPTSVAGTRTWDPQPNTNTNIQCITDNNPNTWVQTINTNTEYYNYAPIADPAPVVYGLQLNSICTKGVGLGHAICNTYQHGATQIPGVDISLSEYLTNVYTVVEQEPDTAILYNTMGVRANQSIDTTIFGIQLRP